MAFLLGRRSGRGAYFPQTAFGAMTASSSSGTARNAPLWFMLTPGAMTASSSSGKARKVSLSFMLMPGAMNFKFLGDGEERLVVVKADVRSDDRLQFLGEGE